MRWIVVLLLLTALGIMFFQKPAIKTPIQQTKEEQPPASPADATVMLGDTTFSVYWQKINANNLSLIPNFDEKKTAREIIEEHGCQYGVNGGFYSSQHQPIGLFVARGIKSPAVTNSTFNGFFSSDGEGLSITRNAPTATVDFAIQSGPYITTASELRIGNDEPARRVLVVRVNTGWYFLAIAEENNTFGVPLLSDVPKILSKLPMDIDEALNLDGGSASVFYSQNGVRLGELTPIGSFFCGK